MTSGHRAAVRGQPPRRRKAVEAVRVLLVLGLFCLAACGGPGAGGARGPALLAAKTASKATVAQARLWSAEALTTVDTVPGTSLFAVKDNLRQSMDCLRVIALQPGSYLGVYQAGAGSHFAVDLAASDDLRSWHRVTTLEGNASQPDLVAAGGGFLLAAEATTYISGSGVHYIELRYYPNVSSLMLSRAARTLTLPHRLAAPESGVEGTPVIETVSMNGGLDHSAIVISFHYLAPGLVDREGIGELTDFSAWSERKDNVLDGALIRAGINGKHGDRSFVPGTSGALELVEAQSESGSPWEVYLFNRVSAAVTVLRIRTPGGSRSFANPAITCVPDPAGVSVALVTLFLPDQQAGPGEAGELLYFQPSSLCVH